MEQELKEVCKVSPQSPCSANSEDKNYCRLCSAFEQNQIELYLQPIYNVRTEQFSGAEALSRWNHPEKGVLLPSYFIEDMNRLGLIDRLDFYTLDHTCALAEKWKHEGRENLNLSCNFSRSTFSSPDFEERFKAIVQRYDFDRRHLRLEITEDTLVDNPAVTRKNIVVCRSMGFTIALDDLGAGYTSFNDLSVYPLDIVKVDRSLTVKSVTTRGFRLLRGLIELCHHLGMQVLCEGVESEEERSAVLDCGADYIQGFYYARPCPLDQALAILDRDQ